MPYYYDHEKFLRPKSREEFFNYIWGVVKADLRGMKFQTKQNAINKTTKRFLEDDEFSFDSLIMIPYRKSDDRGNLRDFYELALRVLEITRKKIDAKEFDAEFFQAWTLMVACHGFVCNTLMSFEDDMQSERAKARSAQSNNRLAQLKWYLHWRRWQVEEQKDSVIRFHRDFLDVTFGICKDKVEPPLGFEKEWFSKALGVDKENKVIAKVLPENFKRSKKNKDTPRLLASKGHEEPKIPPIGRQNYTFL